MSPNRSHNSVTPSSNTQTNCSRSLLEELLIVIVVNLSTLGVGLSRDVKGQLLSPIRILTDCKNNIGNGFDLTKLY